VADIYQLLKILKTQIATYKAVSIIQNLQKPTKKVIPSLFLTKTMKTKSKLHKIRQQNFFAIKME
jgi:hypothetical protein